MNCYIYTCRDFAVGGSGYKPKFIGFQNSNIFQFRMSEKRFHIVMYPWFALGHVTSFLHLSNKLAERGHRISFLLPPKAISKCQPLNLYGDFISFVPVMVPRVDGLPPDAETTADIPFQLHNLLMTAMDLTEPVVEAHLINLKPDFVFFDFTYWLPALSLKLGIKSLLYCTISPAAVGYLLSPERKLLEKTLMPADLMEPPLNFPQSSIKLRAHEARELATVTKPYGRNISFLERQLRSLSECDAIGFKTCIEMEGPYCHYVEQQFGKPVILAGPVVPESPTSVLDEEISKILDNHEAGSVVFCAFGSECILKKDQFQELLLGLELTGLPFLAALKPPIGAKGTIESALPTGVQERVKGKGYIYDNWIQQLLILKHPAVGCFVTHCGSGSLSEAMVNTCQLVLLPNVGDQIINARLMGGDLKVGVEVEKSEDGLFTRDGICKAVKAVMDDDSEVGKEARRNHNKWKDFLLSNGLESTYIDAFVNKLHACLG
ncbi:cyanidin 3-O-galactoside 2''-O-xylosyltransferase FGGT1-like [Mercurialis annua]|uniref:cyanidin 3-O-galactoside 2''-O-xylosyltransferase FGGT1-like n=1 Tax=Mercurialis annua TaxID=3986 RepID=UPI002160A59D|nr:cyanidin 3-O-galactoside 2''-O-xylosyltransferase FGGT1-like [Mercurialis annua]